MTPIAQLLGGGRQISAPSNRQELESLISHRDELREQLSSMNDRREELAGQLHGVPNEARGEITTRLRNTDQRIAKLEADLDAANEQVAAAMAKGIGRESAPHAGPGQVIEIPPIPPIPGFTFGTGPQSWQDRLAQNAAVTLPLTVATVVLLGAVFYWRISRALKQQFASLINAQAGRLEELQRSIDSVAVEVERVSENQRYVTKLVGEKSPASSLDRR